MGLTTYDKAAVTGAQHPYHVAVEIYASRTGPVHAAWFDINAQVQRHASDPFFNRLVKDPVVELKTEARPGRYATSISELVVDDYDSTFAGSLWTFYSDTGLAYTVASWHGAKLRIRIGEQVSSQTATTWHELGTWEIEDVRRRNSDKTARIKLVGLEKKLMDLKAADFKRGDSWLVNTPIPMLVEELIARAGGGTIGFEADSPPSSINTSLPGDEFSVLGRVPITTGGAGSQTWNEDKDFVPRYSWIKDGNAEVVYFCGYSIQDNAAMVARWNRANDTWLTKKMTTEGYEFIFGAYDASADATNIYVVAIRNTCGRQHEYTPANVDFSIKKFNADSLVYTGNAYADGAVYMPNILFMQGVPTDPWRLWGDYTDAFDNRTMGVPVLFRSWPSAPDRDVFYWTSTLDDSGQYSPSRVQSAYDDISGDNAALTHALDTGYYRAIGQPHTATAYGMRTYTHAEPHEGFRYDETRTCIYWMQWDRDYSNDCWRLHSYNISSGVHGAVNIDFGGAHGSDEQSIWYFGITAWDLCADSASAGKVWIATVDSHTSTYSSYDFTEAKLYSFEFGSGNLSSPSDLDLGYYWNWSTEYGASGPAARRQLYAPVIISIRHHTHGTGNHQPLFGQVVNIRAANGHCYGWWVYEAGATVVFGDLPSNRGTLPVSTAPFSLSHLPHETGGVYERFYALNQATGALTEFTLYRISDAMNDLIKVQMIGNGEAADSENVWASSPPLWDMQYDRLIGVNVSDSPADVRTDMKTFADWGSLRPQLGANSPGGRISLWQYGSTVSDVVPVADFGDASVWDALDWLREICGDYVMGFNQAGDFYFKARPSGGSSAYRIRPRGEMFIPADSSDPVLGAESIESKIDHAGIINRVTIPIWIGERDDPKITLALTPNSTAQDCGVTANYVKNQAQRVILRCIGGGRPVKASGAEMGLLFSWGRALVDVDTALKSAAITTASTISVYGLYEDETGKARIGESEVAAGDDIRVGDSTGVRQINTIDVGAGTIELTNPIGGTATHPIGTAVVITPQYGRRYSDSGEGVCTVTRAVGILGYGANTYLSLYVNDISRIRPGMVMFKIGGGYYRVVGVSRTAESAGDYWVGLYGSVVGTGKGKDTSWAVDDVLSAAVWIEYSGQSYAVGDTGVSFSIFPPSAESHDTGEWHVGDQIRITCAGLQAKKMPHAVYRNVNQASVEKYGAKDYKGRGNRLITPVRAKAILEALSDYADPLDVTTAEGLPLLTGVDHSDIADVQDAYLFPDEADYGVDHYVVGIKWYLGTKSMTMTLKATSGAGRAAAAGDGADTIVARGFPKHEDKRTIRIGS